MVWRISRNAGFAVLASAVVLSLGMTGQSAATETACNGGAAEGVFGLNSNTMVYGEPYFGDGYKPVAIPLTTTAAGPSGNAGDSDLYKVTFSGEFGTTAISLGDQSDVSVIAEVSVNGGAFVPMAPDGIITIHYDYKVLAHTMTWCQRIIATQGTKFRIKWNHGGPKHSQPWIDNYTMLIERFN